jgi:hypothetical protein
MGLAHRVDPCVLVGDAARRRRLMSVRHVAASQPGDQRRLTGEIAGQRSTSEAVDGCGKLAIICARRAVKVYRFFVLRAIESKSCDRAHDS